MFVYILVNSFLVVLFCEAQFHQKNDSIITDNGNNDDPLFLTPYIEKGQIAEAQAAAMVQPLKCNVLSYSGYLTVNKNYNSNLFFWFFPAENNNTTAPVVLWLEGGPGLSSIFSLFEEIGPFYVNLQGELEMRSHYWSQKVNMIFIDNPVGTGFSFTENDAGYCTTDDAVAIDLYSAVTQFFQLFPQYKNNDFYLAGESYGGKYVPSLADVIDKNNPKSSVKINLKGLSIGNGFCDPISMLNYGTYFYQLGLVDDHGRAKLETSQDKIVSLIEQDQYKEAFEEFDRLIEGDFVSKTIFTNLTGFTIPFNYLHTKEYTPFGNFTDYVMIDDVRRRIHVGNHIFSNGGISELYLINDIMKSMKPVIESLLEKYPILFYSGQVDPLVPYPFSEDFIKILNWSGKEMYKTAQREFWYVNGELAGYVKKVKYLTEVLVRNAGHFVPTDQPVWALDLIQRFTSNKPFNDTHNSN